MPWISLGSDDCSESYNVIHRSIYGVDSPCTQSKQVADLIRAGATPTAAANTVAQHQEQMKSTDIGSEFNRLLTQFAIGAGVIFGAYILFQWWSSRR